MNFRIEMIFHLAYVSAWHDTAGDESLTTLLSKMSSEMGVAVCRSGASIELLMHD